MKLKLEVIHADSGYSDSVVLKPLYCGLEGTLVYRGLPKRAIERFKKGDVVDAEVPLPDFYPSPNEGRDLGYMSNDYDPQKEAAGWRHGACVSSSWREICDAPMNVRILLGAFDYFGPGKHAVVIGEGTPPNPIRPDSIAGWRADLGNGMQNFTPTHWQPLPRLVVNYDSAV
jgi:hypothetical protein